MTVCRPKSWDIARDFLRNGDGELLHARWEFLQALVRKRNASPNEPVFYTASDQPTNMIYSDGSVKIDPWQPS